MKKISRTMWKMELHIFKEPRSRRPQIYQRHPLKPKFSWKFSEIKISSSFFYDRLLDSTHNMLSNIATFIFRYSLYVELLNFLKLKSGNLVGTQGIFTYLFINLPLFILIFSYIKVNVFNSSTIACCTLRHVYNT